MLVVVRDLVACDHDSVRRITQQPTGFRFNVLVGTDKWRFDHCVRIIEPQDQFSVPFFGVFTIDDNASGMAETHRSVWIWCKSKNDLSFFGILQFWQANSSFLLFSLFKKMWCFFIEHGTQRIQPFTCSHCVRFCNCFCDQW